MIIPARYGSTRFPAKILAAQTGRPLVQHVVDQCRKCARVREVIVATDDQRIADALRPFDTRVLMTSPEHQSGTDRVAEVARGVSDEIVVNVQGDEPEIEPSIVDALIVRLEESEDDMATAATPFPADLDPSDPNFVKVVVSRSGYAMYFSRYAIPYLRDRAPGVSGSDHLLHLGIYAYRREFLLEYASWSPAPCEKAERLEQLRVLECDHMIHVSQVQRATHGVDTPEQYAAFVKRWRSTANA